MHFIPCTIYLGHSLPSPLGPMNRTSFFAVSALTKNTRILGSLSLAPGQVYFRAPHPHPPTPTTQTQLPSVHSPLPLTSFFAPLEWNKLEITAPSLAGHLNIVILPNNWGGLALEGTDVEWCLLTGTTLNHFSSDLLFFFSFVLLRLGHVYLSGLHCLFKLRYPFTVLTGSLHIIPSSVKWDMRSENGPTIGKHHWWLVPFAGIN